MKSFSQMLRAGATRDELMKRFCLVDSEYEKVVRCLERLHDSEAMK